MAWVLVIFERKPTTCKCYNVYYFIKVKKPKRKGRCKYHLDLIVDLIKVNLLHVSRDGLSLIPICPSASNFKNSV